MCLYTTKRYSLVAEKDIVCYKKLILIYKRYITPYKLADVFDKYQRNFRLYADKNVEIRQHGTTLLNDDGSLYYVIEAGYIHSFIKLTKEDGLNGNWNEYFKCVIPKGRHYYKGKYDDYASDCIVFKGKYRFSLFNKPIFF